jgi:pimeloyl-ACP methyl ester carboxylesterase
MKKGLAIGLGILVLLLTGIFVYAQTQPLGEPVEIGDVPPAPGILVDAGGYQLHLYCIGEGSPTVILEPGFGRFSLNWRGLQHQLSPYTRVCAYDHAGLGWSETGVLPRTTDQMVEELHTLLENADIAPPYLIVGHSLGGFTVRLFAARYPDQTTGVVLVDASPPAYIQTLIETEQQEGGGLSQMLQMALLVAQTGLWTEQTIAPVNSFLDDVDDADHEGYIALITRPQQIETMIAEWRVIGDSAQQVIDSGSLGEIPLIVLFAGDRLELAEPLDGDWVQWQLAQAQLSSDNQLIAAVGSGHSVQVDRPDAILDAILSLLARP